MGITVLDHVQRCYTTADGDQFYRVLVAALEAHDHVTISFKGVGDVPSSFVNASFARLLDTYSFDDIRRHVSIVDSNRQINEMIASRMRFAAQRQTEAA